jgi:glutamate synthase (NADPH/NADH) large chain
VLSDKNKPLYNYFKQLFAQVTNPPIDPIREAIVMSLVSASSAPSPTCWTSTQVNPPMRLEVTSRCWTSPTWRAARHREAHARQVQELHARHHLPAGLGPGRRRGQAGVAVRRGGGRAPGGHNILIISDRAWTRDQVAIPALLALSAIHQHLVREGLRTTAGLVVETGRRARCTTSRAGRLRRRGRAPLPGDGDAGRDPQGPAGRPVGRQGHLQLRQGHRQGPVEDHVQDGRQHLHVVLRRAAVRGHRPAEGLVEKYFRGTASQVGGIGVFEVAEEALRMHRAAFGTTRCWPGMLDAGGEYAWRTRGEEHMWTPDAIAKLQHSTRANNFDTYKEYAQIINDQSRRHMTLRGLFEFKVDPAKAIPLDEVEPAKPRSSSASPPAPCRWARSAPRRTPRWPSP